MDRDVIQNMRKRDTDHSGNDKNEVRLRARVDRRADFAKREREGQSNAELIKLTMPKLRIEPS